MLCNLIEVGTFSFEGVEGLWNLRQEIQAIIFLLLKVSLSLWDTSEPWGNDYREEEVTIENREANS